MCTRHRCAHLKRVIEQSTGTCGWWLSNSVLQPSARSANGCLGSVRRNGSSQRAGCQGQEEPNPCREATRSFLMRILTVLPKTAKETWLL